MTLYEQAKAKYAALGIDVEAAMDKLVLAKAQPLAAD